MRVKQRSKVACVSERLETVPVGPELRPGHRSATGERRGKRQHSAVCFDILGQGHCRPRQHWNCLKRSIRETFIGKVERIIMGYFEDRHATLSNSAELR